MDDFMSTHLATSVILEVRQRNERAQNLYRKCGFNAIRTIKNYYMNPSDDAIVMQKVYEPSTPSTRLSSGITPPLVSSCAQSQDPGAVLDSATYAQNDDRLVNAQNDGQTVVLGIESSCDETGAAVVSGGKVLGSSLSTSLDQHIVFGGVIPEIASRMHLEFIDTVVDTALEESGLQLQDLTAVAVTAAPGLTGCLTVGCAYAKGLSLGLKLPIYGVNHVLGHIYAASLELAVPQQFLGLIASGGHTSLVLVDGLNFTPLGGTIDDAAGEAFDKVGRLLGLDYPAGPKVDQLASRGNPQALKFPHPLLDAKFDDKHKYDFSFSGLKTAAVRELERQKALPESERVSMEDFCASFAEAVAYVLTKKTARAVEEFKVNTVLIGGGFSANSQLRAKLGEHCAKNGITLIVPPLKLCTDNGEMIANLGEKLICAGAQPTALDFSVRSTLSLDCAIL
jgi:N6-L-threonylcarbamoyladenine synthase